MEVDVKPIRWEGKNIGDIMNGVVFVAPRHGKKHLFRGGRGKTVASGIKAKTAAWSFNVGILTCWSLDHGGGRYWQQASVGIGNVFGLGGFHRSDPDPEIGVEQ